MDEPRTALTTIQACEAANRLVWQYMDREPDPDKRVEPVPIHGTALSGAWLDPQEGVDQAVDNRVAADVSAQLGAGNTGGRLKRAEDGPAWRH